MANRPRDEGRAEAHEGHRRRMRERAQNEGFENFEPHEVLEFLLYYLIPRQDVNLLAHELLNRFGTLRGVLHADRSELKRVSGLGARSAEGLMKLGELLESAAALELEDRQPLRNFLDVFRYAMILKRSAHPPETLQLLTDFDGRLVFQRTLCPSTAWGEPETLRAALYDALAMRARCAVVIEFIGNECDAPDEYDTLHAGAYAHALAAAGCQLMDVVRVGEGGVSSLRQLKLVPELEGDEIARALREDYLRRDDGADGDGRENANTETEGNPNAELDAN